MFSLSSDCIDHTAHTQFVKMTLRSISVTQFSSWEKKTFVIVHSWARLLLVIAHFKENICYELQRRPWRVRSTYGKECQDNWMKFLSFLDSCARAAWGREGGRPSRKWLFDFKIQFPTHTTHYTTPSHCAAAFCSPIVREALKTREITENNMCALPIALESCGVPLTDPLNN